MRWGAATFYVQDAGNAYFDVPPLKHAELIRKSGAEEPMAPLPTEPLKK